MKRVFFYGCLAVLLCGSLSVEAQTVKVSVLGDSYSTFEGCIKPSTNLCWYYNRADQKNDVRKVEFTWWHQLIDSLDWQLEVNNSYSGATICCTGYRGEDYSDRAFISRMYNLGNPDVIFIFGGTNDSWAKAPVGEYEYRQFTKHDLFSFRPAMAYMLAQMKEFYPHAKIYFLLNTDLREEVNESVTQICAHYQVPCIVLQDIDKQMGHPSIKGMTAITRQIMNFLQGETSN